MLPKKDRIVIDTNLWISFLLSGNYAKLDKLIYTNSVVLLFSDELLEEFIDVACRPKFRKYFTTEDLIKLLFIIEQNAEFIQVESELAICRDPKDNFLLALALEGKATHLLTGDKDLTELEKIGGTVIIPLTEYLKNK
ncbi:MAG TPA: putative toxin-antitoxin system toxin component, PIN family [Flavobacteriales bacterium]|nr:putative toxin-antitoxin system toxin component, PIN family [Flavobacteriales bacterium]HPH83329.1 putative toxin-antitoxin system toxin component, PIN family [Flavobacteriales bacterium]